LIHESIFNLKRYCEGEKFKGWDPYDGMNSLIFQNSPFIYWDITRLIWIQLFKRSPINFRNLFLVPKSYNAKGIALLLSAYCNLYKLASDGNDYFGNKESILLNINLIAKILISLESKGFAGSCWGYNFGWQARRLFYFPKNTPTVVATSFCVESLIKAYEITKNEKFLDKAISSSKFVLKDLKRTKSSKGFLFSYSPINGNNTVFNASLLGAKILIMNYNYTNRLDEKNVAEEAIKSVCEYQKKDGSWEYGLLPIQNWIDSFHTGYNIQSINTYKKITKEDRFDKNINLGFDFYINSFFTKNGVPKYYHNKMYPIDIHCPAQLLITISSLGKYKEYSSLLNKVISWTIKNMQDRSGFFYYQLKKNFSSKISYMRWSNAFMFNAFSYYLLDQFEYEK
tara:strand:- start:4936 stop:6126 length:1191 start_codon:yes stop_codon:yes gene_type:complete